jgi:hypothetical protein
VPSTCYPHDDLKRQIPAVYYFGGPDYKKATVQDQALPISRTLACYSGTMRGLFAGWLLDTLAYYDFWHLFPQVKNNSLTMGDYDTLNSALNDLVERDLFSLEDTLLVSIPSRQPLRTFDSDRHCFLPPLTRRFKRGGELHFILTDTLFCCALEAPLQARGGGCQCVSVSV